MRIQEVLQTVNRMMADGVIERYAIGGAVGATFYLEPVSTLDVDIFIEVHAAPDSLIVTLDPIFRYLMDRGCTMEGDYVVIADSPVQFLPPPTPLAEEALREAVKKEIDSIPVWVFTAEHIAALALQLGRPKDKTRLLQFIEARVLNQDFFQAILRRHGLIDRWHQFERQFLNEPS